MSDEEEASSSEEEEETPTAAPPAAHADEEEREKVDDVGEKQAQLAMQKRREIPMHVKGLTDENKEMLQSNVHERSKMDEEINEMKQRSDRRKKEIQEENKRLQQLRIEEDNKRKADEEERRRKKDEDERTRREARAEKMAEFEKWKNPPQRNFVITKKAGGDGDEEEADQQSGQETKKSKEQLEAEKRSALAQRIPHVDVRTIEASRLAEKAKELYNLVCRLEGEKYDLERRFKTQQVDMIELAERARNMSKGGKSATTKKLNPASDEVDKIQERHAGAPVKVEMFSKYERQKDKRNYGDRRVIYTGPQYGYPAEKIKPTRVLSWDDQGQPIYEGGSSEHQNNAGEE